MTLPRSAVTADGRRFETLSALVDGSNLAYDGAVPRVSRLMTVRRALESAGFDAVEVVCDANLRHRFRERNRQDARAFDVGLRSRLWSQSPAGVSADQVLLRRLNADPDAIVVSNDAFAKDEDDAYRPGDLAERHVRVHFHRDGVQLLYPEGWRIDGNGWFSPSAAEPTQSGRKDWSPAEHPEVSAPRQSRFRAVPRTLAAASMHVLCLMVLLGSALPWVQVPRPGNAGLETRTGFEMGYLTGAGLAEGHDGFVIFFVAGAASLLALFFALSARSWLALLIGAFGLVVVLIAGYDWVRLQLLDPRSELAGRPCNPACVLGGTYLTLGAGVLLVATALVSRWVLLSRRRR